MARKVVRLYPSIFDGDGRRCVEPVNAPEGTAPLKIRSRQARMLCNEFERRGVSYHSSRAGTVWVIVTHCIEQRIPYAIVPQSLDGEVIGWAVTRTDKGKAR